ncbi:MAG: hypothetical protein R3F14_18370 [Polyangiaceae bacterium]
MKSSRWIVAAGLSAQILASGAALAQAKPAGPGAKAAPAAPAKGGGKTDPKKEEPKAEPTPLDKAMEFVKHGDDSAKAGEWEDAYADYSIAWSMYQGWETARGVGESAAKTGHHAEAVARLTLFLKSAPEASVPQKERDRIQAIIDESIKQTGTLTIVAPEGGDVLIDRNAAGKTPLPEAVRLDPGKHEVEIRRGDTGETKFVEITAGQSADLKFEPKAPTQVFIEPENKWRTPVLITGSTLTVAGLALGGVFLGLSFDRAAAKEKAAEDPRKAA